MRVVSLLLASCGLVFAGIPAAAQPSGSATAAGSSDKCAQLIHLTLPSASVTTAKTYAAGTFVGPPEYFSGADLSAFYSKLPEFCRVIVDAKPSGDSDIKIEVWMPIDEWNGRLKGTGNGGFAGQIALDGLGELMAKGYAATATDAGHTGSPVDGNSGCWKMASGGCVLCPASRGTASWPSRSYKFTPFRQRIRKSEQIMHNGTLV